MEPAMIQFSSDQPAVYPYKQIRTPRNINRSLISKPSEKIHGGPSLAPPPSCYFSCPSSASMLFNHAIHQYQNNQLQPPLLPLPITKPYHSFPSQISRFNSLPLPLTNRKNNKSTLKKPKVIKREEPRTESKPEVKSYDKPKAVKKEDPRSDSEVSKPTELESDGGSVISSGKPSGPEPDELPRDVSRVLLSSPTKKDGIAAVFVTDLKEFSGSEFMMSPPPSSLPLPKFSLRRKLGCNAEAAGIDAGTTDDLRRMLRMP